MDCDILIDGNYGIQWMIPNSICSLFHEDFWNAISLNMVITVVSTLLFMFTIGMLLLFRADSSNFSSSSLHVEYPDCGSGGSIGGFLHCSFFPSVLLTVGIFSKFS